MSVAVDTLEPDLPAAGDAVPGDAVSGGAMAAGRQLLGYVQRIMGAGMQMAGQVNRIARQRLEGQPLSRLGPPGFSPTAVNALVVQAVAWMAVLRERLLAVTRPTFLPAVPAGLSAGTARGPQGRTAASFLPQELPNPTEHDWHDYWELAKPFRLGRSGIAAAVRLTEGLSNEAVVEGACNNLSQASAQMGADADVARFAAMEQATRALCAKLEAATRAAAAAAAAGAEQDAADPDGPAVTCRAGAEGPPWHEPGTGPEDQRTAAGGDVPPEAPDDG